MPRVGQPLLDCAVYLYPSTQQAEDGEGAGASGFIIKIPYAKYPLVSHAYVVTSAHCVEACLGKFNQQVVIRFNNADRQTTSLQPTTLTDWHFHPDGDDLAICEVNLDYRKHAFCAVNITEIADRKFLEAGKIGIGNEVLMVGRFVSQTGKQTNTPTARFGNIALFPEQPIEFKERKPAIQDSYLIECRSISGYSGSPVFVYSTGIMPMGLPHFETRLLGIDRGHLNLDKESNSGIAAVVPGHRLLDMLNRQTEIEHRQEVEALFDAQPNDTTLD